MQNVHLDRFLRKLVELGVPSGTDAEGEWFTVVPNDPDELGQSRSYVGLRIKIAGNTATGEDLHVVDVTTYNR